MHVSLLATAVVLSFAVAEPIPVHRPDLIRARCVNDTKPPYGYEPQTESFYPTRSSILLSATAATGKVYKSSYPIINSSTALVLLDPTETAPSTGYPSSGHSSVLVGVTGSSSKSYKSEYHPYRPSGTSVIVIPSGTGSNYPTTKSTRIGYRNSSSSLVVIDATGFSSSRKLYPYTHKISSTFKLVDPTGTGPKYPISTSANSSYGIGSSVSAVTGPAVSGSSSRPSGYPTGAHTYGRNSTSKLVIRPTGTGSAYSSSAKASGAYSYISASTGIFASSISIKLSSSALFPNSTSSRTGIDTGPTAASTSIAPSSSAKPGHCPHDNVLRALLRHDVSASSFCPRYLRPRGSYGPVIPLPVYLSGFPTSRVSTACSCFTAGITTTVRATSTFIVTVTRSSLPYTTSTSIVIGPVETTTISSTLPLATTTVTSKNGTKSNTLTDSYVCETRASVSISPTYNTSTSSILHGTGYSGTAASTASAVSTVTVIKTSGYGNSTSVVIGSPITGSSSASASSHSVALPSGGSTYDPIQSSVGSTSASTSSSKPLYGYAPKPYRLPPYSAPSYTYHYE